MKSAFDRNFQFDILPSITIRLYLVFFLLHKRAGALGVGNPGRGSQMNFLFVCPEKNKTFESPDFKVIENNGIVTDENGNKQLDAKVILSEPCPFCGKRHTYHANELTCPFT